MSDQLHPIFADIFAAHGAPKPETPAPAAGHEASGLAAQRNPAGRDINARTQAAPPQPNGTNQPDHQSNGSF